MQFMTPQQFAAQASGARENWRERIYFHQLAQAVAQGRGGPVMASAGSVVSLPLLNWLARNRF